MKIEPCIKELKSEWFSWPIVLVIEMVFCFLLKWDPYAIAGILVPTCILLFFVIRRHIYLGRTITLTPDGCVFSIMKHRWVYKWADLKIQDCENRPRISCYLDVFGPGIIICDKSLEMPENKAGPAFCRSRHPIKSVFIRFKTPKDTSINAESGPRNYIYGYAVEKEEILGYLKSIGVL